MDSSSKAVFAVEIRWPKHIHKHIVGEPTVRLKKGLEQGGVRLENCSERAGVTFFL